MKKDNKIGVGKFAGSRKRWWNSRMVESSEPPCFQRYQFDSSLGHGVDGPETKLSGRALANLYGDSSLEWHIGSMLIGIHDLVTLTDKDF